ncbi:glycosyltransferase [Mangrovimonas xylaniphaga]|uniref:glycosyltransferase n=1 Tax=Mangrovimonas xylaniphaga TaxID=1645915 RepID=UPI0006B5F37F|nr:glycosyltransferase [Mangrovimonas xylaniphaga]
MMFKHYLVTRFNLKNPSWNTTKNNETLLTDEWMEHRMWLFENFCLPSILAQSNQNFKWLIFFDNSTSDKFKEQIHELLKGHDIILPFFIDGMVSFHPSIMDFITQDASKDDYIITSRIDNDDCISKYYIDTVQKQFNQQSFLAIDIVKGYSLQISPEVMLGKKEHVFNPFISLIEKKENFKTVWQSDHNMWKTENRIVKVTKERLWMSIIHEKNKVNMFDGYDAVDWKTIKSDFVVSKEIDAFVSQNLIPEKEWKTLSLKNKLYVKYVLLSKTLKKGLGIYKLKK